MTRGKSLGVLAPRMAPLYVLVRTVSIPLWRRGILCLPKMFFSSLPKFDPQPLPFLSVSARPFTVATGLRGIPPPSFPAPWKSYAGALFCK